VDRLLEFGIKEVEGEWMKGHRRQWCSLGSGRRYVWVIFALQVHPVRRSRVVCGEVRKHAPRVCAIWGATGPHVAEATPTTEATLAENMVEAWWCHVDTDSPGRSGIRLDTTNEEQGGYVRLRAVAWCPLYARVRWARRGHGCGLER
jgi:hypothetical protein